MHWLLQENIFNEAKYEELERTLGRFGLPYSKHKVVPFVGEIMPDFEAGPDDRVIVFGSYSMRHMAKKKGLYPGVFDLFEQDFEVQLEHWGEHMLNHDSHICKFSEVRPTDDQFFIRPVDDSKHFAGKVIDRHSFTEWQHRVVDLGLANNGTSLTGDTVVQVSPLKVIHREVRYWVIKGRIVTSSVYKTGNRVQYFPNIDERMDAYVRACVAMWEPAEAFVIDVCERGWEEHGLTVCQIVEINTINSSGFYAADVQKLVFAMEEAFG